MTTLQQAMRAVTHPDPDVRQEAAMRLGTLADATVAGELVQRLVDEPDFFVRETLTWVIVAQQEATVPHLVKALAGQHPSRAQVLHALSKIGDPGLVEHIVPLARDPDPAVQAKAWWALGRIALGETAPALMVHLGAGDPEQRQALTSALGQFGAPAVPALAAHLSDPSPAVRRHAAEALSAIGDPGAREAADALVAYVDSAVDQEEGVIAIGALGQLDVSAAQAALERLRASEDTWVSLMADWLIVDRAERRAKAQRRRKR